VEHARGRDRRVPDGIRSQGVEERRPQRPHRAETVAAAEDGAVDIERFPVMIRLSQIQGEIRSLAVRLDDLHTILERLERAGTGGLGLMRPVWQGVAEPIPYGITARANPMTHPVTPLSADRTADVGREEALAGVRALFLRRRSWWQRLPDLLRG
jgi:hypothetical protein